MRLAKQLEEACLGGERMAEFDRQYTNNPMFKVFWQ